MSEAVEKPTEIAQSRFKPYAEYKDSGVEWLGRIPAHWKVRRNGFLFVERDQSGYPDLPLLNVSIKSGVQVREFSDEHIEQRADDPSTYKRAIAGDIAFNKMRMWQGAVGVAPVDGLVSPDYTVAVPTGEADAMYFAYLFRVDAYMAEVYRQSHGIVEDRNHLYWEGFKDIWSPLPASEEQGEIVTYLGRKMTKIDALAAKIRDAIDRLKELRAVLISVAVTGKIDVREEAELLLND